MELFRTDDDIAFCIKIAQQSFIWLKIKKKKKSIGKNEQVDEHNANIFSYRNGNLLIKTERNEKLELIKWVVRGKKELLYRRYYFSYDKGDTSHELCDASSEILQVLDGV